jgi:lysophospholipase L1-like esterase
MRLRYGFWIVLLALLFLPKAVWSQTVVPFNDANWFFSPYNWTPLGTTEIVANEPGAYCLLTFSNSSQAVLNLDTAGIPPAIGSSTSTTMVVQWSINNIVFPPHTLLTTDTQLTLATGLTASAYTLRFWFVASNNYSSNADYKDRWTRTVPVKDGYLVPPQSLRITGISLDSGATVSPPALRPKRALFFGDSITEGLHVYSTNPAISDSEKTYAIACAGQLNAEYGIVGNAGQGWAKTLSGSGVPPFVQAFSQFYADTPRFPLPTGTQAPDYVFLNMGTNDDLNPRISDDIVTGGALAWLQQIRTYLPTSEIILVVPFRSSYAAALKSAYNQYQALQPNDKQILFLNLGFTAMTSITNTGGSSDTIHPYAPTQAALGYQLTAALQTALGRNDFNKDGLSDLVLQNTISNQIALWFLNGATVLNGAFFPSIPDGDYQIVGSADFNGDGKPDLVFQNQRTGQVAIWYVDGTNLLGGVMLPQTPASGYKIVGVGDFNGDGKPDLVFQNQTTNQIVFWFMDGVNLIGGSALGLIPASGYHVVGVADFNRDGQTDLLFQSSVSGQLVLWYMNAAQVQGGAVLSKMPSAGYQVESVADFDNDGRPDILLRSPDGTIQLWHLDDALVYFSETLSVRLPTTFRVAGPR